MLCQGLEICALADWAHLTSSLAPVMNDPYFLPGGLVNLGDLFRSRTLLSFQQLQRCFGLQNVEFSRYLQLRHFIINDTTLMMDPTRSAVVDALSSLQSGKSNSSFNKVLNSGSAPYFLAVKQAQERHLGHL